MAADLAISTHGLGRRFGRNWAVRDLELKVPVGSVFAFLGPNGAGKTTTIKMLMNLLSPTCGEAEVLGHPIRNLGPEALTQIGYVSENQKLPEWMTVKQLLDYCKPLYAAWDDAFCARLLKDFDLPPNRKLRHLSRGMKTKAALLSSLAYRPRLLMLDEPFSGLDPLVREEFIQGVLELTAQESWTVFISSHDIDEVERLADWVGVINDGRLHLAESVSSLQARFQRVEVMLGEDGGGPAPSLPDCLQVERSGRTLRFVDTASDQTGRDAALAAQWPPGSTVQRQAMTLRDIFLSLARGFRLTKQGDAA